MDINLSYMFWPSSMTLNYKKIDTNTSPPLSYTNIHRLRKMQSKVKQIKTNNKFSNSNYYAHQTAVENGKNRKKFFEIVVISSWNFPDRKNRPIAHKYKICTNAHTNNIQMGSQSRIPKFKKNFVFVFAGFFYHYDRP